MHDAVAAVRDLVEADLLSRLTQAAPKERQAIHTVSNLAAWIAQTTKAIQHQGCTVEQAALYGRSITTLTESLLAIGEERVHRTVAEHILALALPVNDLVVGLYAVPPGGYA